MRGRLPGGQVSLKAAAGHSGSRTASGESRCQAHTHSATAGLRQGTPCANPRGGREGGRS